MLHDDRLPECSLLVFDAATSSPRHATVTDGATIGTAGTVKIAAERASPIHARLSCASGCWTIHMEGDARVTVNGVQIRRPWRLDGGDRIGIGAGAVVFLPRRGATPIGPGAHGFSTAKYYLQESLKLRDSDRKFVARLARLEEAINDAERHVVVQRAAKLMSANDDAKALAELDRILAVSPRHARALLYKSICLLRMSEVDRARTVAASARDAAQDDPEARKEAIEFLDKIREVGPRMVVNQAIKEMNADRFLKARQILSAALPTYPGDAGILFHLAICQAKAGDIAAARRSLNSITGTVDPELRGEIASLKRQLLQANLS